MSEKDSDKIASQEIPSGFINLQTKIDRIVEDYVDKHPNIVAVAIKRDAALQGKSSQDVKDELRTYPGIAALAVHEVAHELYKQGSGFKKIQARQLSEAAHSRTGIDIHPGTQIGENCFIDHGTGDVIGETAKIGNNTMIYHGVTLGAYATKDKNHRHPEIGDDCLISSGVQVLGNVKVGNKVKIGPQTLIAGDDISIGDDSGKEVNIKPAVRIFNGNHIKAGVTIGEGAVIAKNTGEINQDIPPDSHVSRVDGKLHVTSLKEQESLLGGLINFVEQVAKAPFRSRNWVG